MMSYTQKLKEISDFLKSTSFFWEKEIIAQDTSRLAPHYLKWARDFHNLNLENKVKTYNYQQSTEIKKLCSFPVSDQVYKLNPNDLRQVKYKKRHELTKIIPIINNKLRKPRLILDCCGGVGHLPLTLLKNNQIDSSFTIELDASLIEKGEKLAQDFKEINFIQANIKEFNFTKYNKDQYTALGLHSCGELSESVLRSQSNQIINWGCCYHKMTKTWSPMSQKGKSLSIKLSDNALTLAAKCHKLISSKELESRYRVKKFRYTLELLSSQMIPNKTVATGSLLKKFYQGSFEDYVKEALPEVFTLMDKPSLNSFYQESLNKVEQLIALGFLRDHWGRVIESAIILDRAIYLEENGYQVEVLETFDRELSPRNLMIYAEK